MTMQIADSVSLPASDARARVHAAAARNNLRTEPKAVRIAIIALAIMFLSVFVVLPLVVVFAQAFSKGILAYLAALSDPEALGDPADAAGCRDLGRPQSRVRPGRRLGHRQV